MYLKHKDALGDIGRTSPHPIHLSKHPVSSNILFEQIGQTSPSIGFANIKFEFSTIELARHVDTYQNVMSTNYSSFGEFTCEKHILNLAALAAHMALSEPFHAFCAQTQALHDAFRSKNVLNDDFVNGKGPSPVLTGWKIYASALKS